MAPHHTEPLVPRLPVGGLVVRRVAWPLAQLAGCLIVLWLLAHRLGTTPFRIGLQALSVPAVAVVGIITVLTSCCSALRWCLVARALGTKLALRPAIGAYYRSQFLNSVLPGGVLGDLHRAVLHGQQAGDLGRGLRSVAWERLWGQVTQVVLALVVLAILPSPIRPMLPLVAVIVALGAGGVVVAVGLARRSPDRTRRAAAARSIVGDLRHGLLARTVWPWLTVTSILAVAGYTAMFLVAARSAGSLAPVGELVALALLLQTAMVIPLSIGGWGPREGIAAWSFGAAGLGAAAGVSVTTAFGVLCLIAVSPGAGLLLLDAGRRLRSDRRLHRADRLAARQLG